MQPSIWSIAGFDPSAGAGILADNHIFTVLKINAQTITTAITAQNGEKVNACEAVSASLIESQLLALKAMGWPSVIKVGLLPNAQCIEALCRLLADFKGCIIYDPVMLSSSGTSLMSQEALAVLKEKWLKKITILTPNIHEAQVLTGHNIACEQDMLIAAKTIIALGVKQVIIKGGHFQGVLANDLWTDGTNHFWLSSPRIAHDKTHGTGCVLSASLGAFIAQGYESIDAFVLAKMVLTQSLRAPFFHQNIAFAKLYTMQWQACDVPWLSKTPLKNHTTTAFTPCREAIGLYPIVDTCHWVNKALSYQVNALQLRIKNSSTQELTEQIKHSVKLFNKSKSQLFINDYWQLAIAQKAYGVHLGQEDLDTCDIASLRSSGLRLGISTHSFSELARAIALQPSYIAFGPIYATTTKPMRFPPQGLELLQRWRELVSTQLVAIGGITLANIEAILHCGVDGVSLVSAMTKASNPKLACQALLSYFNRAHYV